MGAWGISPFDNDDADDWVYALEDDGVAGVRGARRPGGTGGRASCGGAAPGPRRLRPAELYDQTVEEEWRDRIEAAMHG